MYQGGLKVPQLGGVTNWRGMELETRGTEALDAVHIVIVTSDRTFTKNYLKEQNYFFEYRFDHF